MTAIDFAITMELDGEKYYAEQAEFNKTNSVGIVCHMLAQAESAHAQLLRDNAARLTFALPGRDQSAELQSVFKDAADFKSDIRDTPNQLEFYRAAMSLEQDSIGLYEKMRGETADDGEKALFEYLIDQEKQHYTLLDGLATMLRHAEEWVESAEFGLRKETY